MPRAKLADTAHRANSGLAAEATSVARALCAQLARINRNAKTLTGTSHVCPARAASIRPRKGNRTATAVFQVRVFWLATDGLSCVHLAPLPLLSRGLAAIQWDANCTSCVKERNSHEVLSAAISCRFLTSREHANGPAHRTCACTGRFSASPGSRNCGDCPAGRFQPYEEQTECKPCDPCQAGKASHPTSITHQC